MVLNFCDANVNGKVTLIGWAVTLATANLLKEDLKTVVDHLKATSFFRKLTSKKVRLTSRR